MKKKELAVIVAIAAMLSITMTIHVYSLYNIVETKELEMSIIVGDTIGFDLDTERITFGEIMRGSTSQRKVFATNSKDIPVMVEITAEGDFSGWITVSENYFVLEPGEKRSVAVSATVPRDADYGEYEGKLVFIMTRP